MVSQKKKKKPINLLYNFNGAINVVSTCYLGLEFFLSSKGQWKIVSSMIEHEHVTHLFFKKLLMLPTSV